MSYWTYDSKGRLMGVNEPGFAKAKADYDRSQGITTPVSPGTKDTSGKTGSGALTGYSQTRPTDRTLFGSKDSGTRLSQAAEIAQENTNDLYAAGELIAFARIEAQKQQISQREQGLTEVFRGIPKANEYVPKEAISKISDKPPTGTSTIKSPRSPELPVERKEFSLPTESPLAPRPTTMPQETIRDIPKANEYVPGTPNSMQELFSRGFVDTRPSVSPEVTPAQAVYQPAQAVYQPAVDTQPGLEQELSRLQEIAKTASGWQQLPDEITGSISGRQNYMQNAAPVIAKIAIERDISPAMLIALIAHETAYGAATSSSAKNLGGVKWTESSPYPYQPVTEARTGDTIKNVAYPSYEASVMDLVDRVLALPYYDHVRAADNWQDATQAIGYSLYHGYNPSNPEHRPHLDAYRDSLRWIIAQDDLARYDEMWRR